MGWPADGGKPVTRKRIEDVIWMPDKAPAAE
jgi:hypothetical protein